MVKQTRPHEAIDYFRAGCMQFDTGLFNPIALGLHLLTGGMMCDGCPKFGGGKCEAFRKLEPAGQVIRLQQTAYTETVRQQAAREGISISEVRRRRSAQ